MANHTSSSTATAISTSTIVKVVVAFLVLWFLYITADILILLVASLLLSAALSPWVDNLYSRFHIPRQVSMIAIYVILIAAVSSAILLLVPPVVEEIQQIAKDFPAYYLRINDWLSQISQSGATSSVSSLSQTLTTATPGVFSFISSIFGGIASFFLVLFMTYYLVVDDLAVKKTVGILSERHQAYANRLIERLQQQVGVWLRAQLILMGVISILTYIVLLIIGMPYALVLALFAGVTEFVPYLGPLLGAVPAVFLAYAISPTMAIIVAFAYYLIQLAENNIIVPKIMEKALGLSPIISIMVFLVGARLAGIAGALLAIPVATAIMVVAKDILAARSARGN